MGVVVVVGVGVGVGVVWSGLTQIPNLVEGDSVDM
jgi:hypothetical protein